MLEAINQGQSGYGRQNNARLARAQTTSSGRTQRTTAFVSNEAVAAARERVVSKRLAELDRENYHDNVKIDIPPRRLLVEQTKVANRIGNTVNSRRVLSSRKTLVNHLDDDPASTKRFADAAATTSRYPPIKLCSICGYWGKMSCIRCGAKYCGMVCEDTHKETRCMKGYA